MSPEILFFDSLNLTLHGLGISCIVGGVGYVTDSRLTYCHIVEWVEKLCRGDSDAILVTLLFLSLASGLSSHDYELGWPSPVDSWSATYW